MDNRTAAPRSTPPSTPPPTSAEDTSEDTAGSGSAADSAATGSEPAATSTTSAAPLRPTADDVELLSFAQQFELTARDLYDVALRGAVADSEHVNVFRTVRENHEEYANALSALLGVAAPQQRDDDRFAASEGDFGADDLDAVIDAAYELESIAVATHTDLVGQLTGVSGAKTLAGALLVESAHCTMLASVAGRADDLTAMLDNGATSEAPGAASGSGGSEPADTDASDTDPSDGEGADSEPDETEPDDTAPETTDSAGSTTETTEA